MDKLAMIPSGKKVSKLYSVFPEDGTGDFSVVSDQKYITNESGLLELVPANTPAFDYSDGTGCPALLVEGASTNLALWSEDFTQVNWLKGNVTLLANNVTAPNGTLTANKMSDDAVDTTHYMVDVAIIPIDLQIYKRSIFVKKGNIRYVLIGVGNVFTSPLNTWIFDLDTGLFTQNGTAGTTLPVVTLANGWFKIGISNISSTGDNDDISVGMATVPTGYGAALDYVGGTGYTYFWGAEVKVDDSSYIKTEGTTVTRAADIETVTTPAVVTSITETIGGVEQTPVLNIFPTYQIPNGSINKLIGTTSSGDSYDFISNYLIRATTDGATATEDELQCLNDELTLDLVNYNNSSLYLNPTLGKASKLYSQKPTDGTGDFTVSRASTATRVNSDGLIETVAANVARIDYTDGGCPVLLTEPQSTNLALWSEDFSNAVWVKAGLPILNYNYSEAPNGTITSTKITVDDSLSERLEQSVSISAGIQYTFSCWVKAGTQNNGNSFLNSDAIGAVNTEIFPTNEWVRYSLIIPSTNTLTSIKVRIYPSSFTGGSFGDNIEIWGAQLEQGSTPTSYIPTTTSTVTRIADVITGAGDVNTFNSEEGVLFVEMAKLSDIKVFELISINDGTSSNRIYISSTNLSNQLIIVMSISTGVPMANITYTVPDITNYIKIAFSYKQNNFNLYIDGVKVASKLSGDIFPINTLNNLSFDNGAGLSGFSGKVKQLKVFKTALTDAQLIALTTL